MLSIGIGEIQKNSSVFSNLTEAIQIDTNVIVRFLVGDHKEHLAKSIDFVDALICAKSKLQGFGKLSFDSDVEKC